MLSRSARSTASEVVRTPCLAFTRASWLSDCVQAEGQLARDVGFVLNVGDGTQHLGLARGQAEAVERGGAEAPDLLLEQQRVRVAGGAS